ncbi:hypothetical protein GQ53DRAFT_744247 [Thozetella sp. PMI_491]|nr:hypothetical protein GQ53DRAFT_744247 [Thozetella sp. PMI_491]
MRRTNRPIAPRLAQQPLCTATSMSLVPPGPAWQARTDVHCCNAVVADLAAGDLRGVFHSIKPTLARSPAEGWHWASTIHTISTSPVFAGGHFGSFQHFGEAVVGCLLGNSPEMLTLRAEWQRPGSSDSELMRRDG